MQLMHFRGSLRGSGDRRPAVAHTSPYRALAELGPGIFIQTTAGEACRKATQRARPCRATWAASSIYGITPYQQDNSFLIIGEHSKSPVSQEGA